MADVAKYNRIYAESLQKEVPEPIEAVAMLSRGGRMGTEALYFASPLAAMIKGKGEKDRAGGLPPHAAVALTATSVYVFAYKPKGRGLKVKGAPTVWRRDAVRILPTGAGHLDGVSVELIETGEVLQLENTALPGLGGFNEAFYARLGAAST
ncbi:MAG: hypothetical protein MUE36_03250 [Acidimicrobiales bacterium]|jgi:hypothetical protein|nr:hypothetical protein [Acidimicrobiales bacterium]